MLDEFHDDLLEPDGLTAEQARALIPAPVVQQDVLLTVRAQSPACYDESTGGGESMDVLLRRVGFDHPILADWEIDEADVAEIWEVVPHPDFYEGLVLVNIEPDEFGDRFGRIVRGTAREMCSPTMSEAVWRIATGH